jgi:hypothetical protein
VCVRGLFSWVTELQEGCLCQEIVQLGNSTAGCLSVPGVLQLGNCTAGGLPVSGDCSFW